MVKILASDGYWVHFIVPDARGAQPFDIVAVKDGVAYAIDCKTSVRHLFGYNRLEENQRMAFRRWLKCGNINAFLAVLYNDCIYMLDFERLEVEGFIDLDLEPVWYDRRIE